MSQHPRELIDCAVVGAGAVGLAVARALALRGREVVVLEAADAVGTGISSRNSEVIHAGIYYPPDSLKARTCVAGRDLLYRFCADHAVEHRRTGKLIVATEPGQADELASLAARARANGVEDIRVLERDDANALETEIRCTGAVLSPSTGIIDSHGYMLALRGALEDRGGVIAFKSPVAKAAATGSEIRLEVANDEPMTLACRMVVNAAGLLAPTLAALTAGYPRQEVPTAYYAKGSYFTYSGSAPFSRLIYPLPHPGGLGIHLTLDLAGQARFGPDVEWVAEPDYAVDPARAPLFADAISAYWPSVDAERLVPGYAGVRPKLVGPGEPPGDFVIAGPKSHGIGGLVNLFGIESPGLTASLALAELVADALGA